MMSVTLFGAAFIGLACIGNIAGSPKKQNNQELRRDDVLTTPPPSLPPCFKRYEHNDLRSGAFRIKKNNDSPQQCADFCTKIHDDQDDVRTCRAFDYVIKTGTCRFFEKNSQEESVRLFNTTKSHVFELDEDCWTRRNNPPTPPPHVSACTEGSKPLLERVTGFYLKASGLAFKQVPENQCTQSCLKDEMPQRNDNVKCVSVSYNVENQACVFLNQIARPLNKNGPPLTSDSRYRYYSKLCLPADAAAKCPGYITRFVGKQLVAMSDAKTTTSDYSECVSACLTSEAKLGFVCRSGMFVNKESSGNCILNYADHYNEHSLFVDDKAQEIDYFSIRSCQW